MEAMFKRKKVGESGRVIPDHEHKTMSEVKSSTWAKMLEVPTKARTLAGVIAALRDAADIYKDASNEEMEELVNSDWVEICADGVIVWEM